MKQLRATVHLTIAIWVGILGGHCNDRNTSGDVSFLDVEIDTVYVPGFDNKDAVYPDVTDDGGTGNVTTYGSPTDPAPSSGGACNYGSTDI